MLEKSSTRVLYLTFVLCNAPLIEAAVAHNSKSVAFPASTVHAMNTWPDQKFESFINQ